MNKQKVIALDARFLNEAGPGRYVKNILENLEQLDQTNEYKVFLKKSQYDAYTPKSSNFTKIEADYSWYSFSEQTKFLLQLIKHRPDLLYVPHFNVPVLFPYKIVTAIPDIIMHSFSTEKGTTLPKPYFKLKKLVYKLVTMWAIYRSSFVIVPSNSTKNDIHTVFGTDEAKLIYAPEGVDPGISKANVLQQPDDFFEGIQVKKPYILYVGSMYEHKNLQNLIHVFANLTQEPTFTLNLVLAGKNDNFSSRIYDLVTDLKLTHRIFLPGQLKKITDQEMNTLRQACDFYVFPSLKEGFSLTPMEAMVFDKACLISDIECHKEIYGDSVMYFNPVEINDIAAKILQMTNDAQIRKTYEQKGKELLSKYSWQQTAQITLATFKRVLNNGQSL